MPVEAQEAWGDRLEDLRKSLRLNWRELREQIGIGETMLHYLRTGKRTPSPKVHRRIEELEARRTIGSVGISGSVRQVDDRTNTQRHDQNASDMFAQLAGQVSDLSQRLANVEQLLIKLLAKDQDREG